MPYKDEIDAAISAHEVWKVRLAEAIESHTVDLPVDRICRDDCCEFGAWLYSDSITPIEKSSQRYKLVRHLHADFHKAAAEVAEFVLAGQAVVANDLMSETGRFSVVSKRLIAALNDWKKITKSAIS